MHIFDKLTITTQNKKYDIVFGEQLLSNINQLLDKILANSNKPHTKIIVITDSNLQDSYLPLVLSALSNSGYNFYYYVIPAGEKSKSIQMFEKIIGFMLESGLDRRSLVLALGGGVTGDLAGYVAAAYMRGIDFIQIPTTILAHDSSVGGKVAINHSLGKNSIGAFHQPLAVIYDMETLKSLPDDQLLSGIAEIVKHGHIKNPELNEWLLNNITNIRKLDNQTLAKMLYKSSQVKAEIVSQDEREQDVRAWLNFGHTVGHGIESSLGYGAIAHGLAVAIGMVTATIIGVNRSLTSPDVLDHVIQVNRALNLPIYLPLELDENLVMEYMKKDKKNFAGKVSFVLLKQLGVPLVVNGITNDEILNAFKQQAQLK